MGLYSNIFPQKVPFSKAKGLFFRERHYVSLIVALWNGLWILYSKSENYVSDVVFYSADYDNLLPVVPDENNGRQLPHDE